MKVLTFCAYFEPEIAASMYLTTNLFEDAANAGIEVELFAPTPTRGVDKETMQKFKKIKYEEHCGGKLKIHRFAMMQEGNGTIGRALRYILLNLVFVWKGLWTKADVMFIDSTPPTQGFMAAFLKKIKRIPVVYNLQDIFPDSMVHTGITREGSLVWKIGRFVENITYKNADLIVVISEDFKQNIMKKGVPEKKIDIVHNWVEETAVKSVERVNNSLFDIYNIDRDKFYVCYSGNIGFTQNMDMLLDIAKGFLDNPEIGFILVGDGAAKIHVEERIKVENINNTIMIPFQPYEKISEVFSLGDCGLIISKEGIGNNSVPSKTWSIMSAERPVLASFDKGYELDRVITEAGCGVCIQAGDKEALKAAILMFNADKVKCSEMGKNGRKYIVDNFTREIGTSKWVKIFRRFDNR